MHSSAGPTENTDVTVRHPGFARFSLRRWSPFLLLVVALGYGLLTTIVLDTPPLPLETGLSRLPTTVAEPLHTHYLTKPLTDILDQERWLDNNWQPVPESHSGLGYFSVPVTFRVTFENPGNQPVRKWAVVSAPSLDYIQPAVIGEDGSASLLPVMGDLYPFNHRLIALPQWVWPITLPPGTSILLFEVRNAGPTMLPLSILEPDAVISESAGTLAWKAAITGLLVFALLFNLSIVAKMKRPGLAWLSVLMFSLIYSQLVMEGFGLWYLWPDLPEMNRLLNITLPLCLIALCQFTPHFMPVPRNAARILLGISVLAFVHLLVIPLALPLFGQGSFLVLAMGGGAMILGLVLSQFRSHLYARYYALSILAILTGSLISSLRTIGWVPINGLTDSAFFLGAAIGSLILTSAVGRQMLEERKRRLSSDIRAQQEQRLRTLAEQDYDRLLKTHRVTGKPNRAMLEESLDGLDSQERPYTLGLIRLERFNEIEQALGYRTTEELLKGYLRQLNSFLKRLFGDRLVMFNGYAIASIDTATHAFALHRDDESGATGQLLSELTGWLEENFREGRFAFSWNASVGIAHAPDHGDDVASALSSAGFAALDRRQTLTVYDPAIAEWQYRQQMLMLDMEGALRDGEMWLEYQPKVCIRDRRTESLEALIRWQHPEFGRVPPDHWVPLAEQVGMIHPVTLWVIDQACRDHDRLKTRHGEHIALAINVSAKDLAHPEFHNEVSAIARRHGIKPEELILEITETAMMADATAARTMIGALSKAGFRIALDDFGTGHSSLGTLATFDLDELKIDRSFLKDILQHPTRQRIFRAALELGDALDLDVVVEGVEDEAVAGWLQQFPGLYGQGYYWARPERLDNESQALRADR
ncbi:EAL domain-containing protein [Marinobacter sp. F4206]|uniref:EAL domain-containing protein n=1 Tax=Marinobacter sp. F4206 TaxID=2861777 RepID=UPI001C5D33C4|nr:EAL domain-containing protein [Marinobacter sp. F4206]MBW4934706.1 EAL domain-containing protein [Marinobacter sp. F4206]